jgi:hypothetical protein
MLSIYDVRMAVFLLRTVGLKTSKFTSGFLKLCPKQQMRQCETLLVSCVDLSISIMCAV